MPPFEDVTVCLSWLSQRGYLGYLFALYNKSLSRIVPCGLEAQTLRLALKAKAGFETHAGVAQLVLELDNF